MVCNLFNDEAAASWVELALKLPNLDIFLINCMHIDSAFIRKLSLAFTVIYKQTNKITFIKYIFVHRIVCKYKNQAFCSLELCTCSIQG